MKKAFKNIMGSILLLFTLLGIFLPFMCMLMVKLFSEIKNFVMRRPTDFPKFSANSVCEIKSMAKEYFELKLWQQSVACMVIYVAFYAMWGKWKLIKS